MTPISRVPEHELARVRGLRAVWREAWKNKADQPLDEVLLGLDEKDLEARIASLTVGMPEDYRENEKCQAKDPSGYPALGVAVEIPTDPTQIRRPLEIVQSLSWNADIIERALEAVVLECRRRGYSWADIAEGLDVARQSAWSKYTSLEEQAAGAPA